MAELRWALQRAALDRQQPRQPPAKKEGIPNWVLAGAAMGGLAMVALLQLLLVLSDDGGKRDRSKGRARDKKGKKQSGARRLGATAKTTRGAKEEEPGAMAVHGFQNMGNTCFMNSLLQVLASCPAYISYLRSIDGLDSSELVASLLECVAPGRRIAGGASFRPDRFYRSLTRKESFFGGGVQHDAHELFHILLDTVEQEGHSARPNPFRCGTASFMECTNCGYQFPVRHATSVSVTLPPPVMAGLSIEKLLSVYTAVESVEGVQCVLCSAGKAAQRAVRKRRPEEEGRQRLTMESGGLPMPYRPASPVSESKDVVWAPVQDSPSKSPSRDRLKRQKKRNSSKAAAAPSSKAKKVAVVVRRHMRLSRLPEVLCLHVSRLMGSQYVEHFLSFPMFLDMSPFSTSSTDYSSKLYKQEQQERKAEEDGGGSWQTFMLSSIVVHYGSATGGHFTTVRRVSPTPSNVTLFNRGMAERQSKWMFVSDDTMKPVTVRQVLGFVAYMLFYERLN